MSRPQTKGAGPDVQYQEVKAVFKLTHGSSHGNLGKAQLVVFVLRSSVCARRKYVSRHNKHARCLQNNTLLYVLPTVNRRR